MSKTTCDTCGGQFDLKDMHSESRGCCHEKVFYYYCKKCYSK